MRRLLSLAVALTLGVTTLLPSPSHAALLAPDTDLRTFVLDANQLGEGFRLNADQSGPRANDANGREDAQRYQQWGRVMGFHAQFDRELGVLSSLNQTGMVVQSVSLYRTPQGAMQAFDFSRQRNGQVGELLGTPQLGEASLAFRMRVPAAAGSQGAAATPAEAVMIQFRKGNLVQSLVVAGPQGAAVLDDALAVATLAASRVPD